MKNILFLIVIVFYNLGVLEAQQIKNIEGKPSYEETIEYISKELKIHEIYSSAELKHNGISKHVESSIKNVKPIFEGKIFKLEYEKGNYRFEHYPGYPPRLIDNDVPYKERIDLSKIESISGYVIFQEVNIDSNRKKSDLGIYYIRLHSKTGYNDVPAGWIHESHLPFKPDNMKIFKAFEHLRKLCGAPDPIDF